MQDQESQLASFLALAEKLSGSGKGAAFHSLVERRALPASLANYLVGAFSAQPGDADAEEGTQDVPTGAAAGAGGVAPLPDSSSEAWTAALALAGPPLALQLLTAFVKGQPVRNQPVQATHRPTRILNLEGLISTGPIVTEALQLVVAAARQLSLALLLTSESAHAQETARTLAEVPQLLALVHAMEGSAGGGTLAPLAEALLDALVESESSEAAAQVDALRSATAKRRAELAARRRQQMLASMSFSQASAERIANRQPPCACTATVTRYA